MFLDLIHIFPLLFNLQAEATTATAPEPTTTLEPESPCSNEDNENQVQPEDNNLTSLNDVEINLTNNSEGSQEPCNTFEPRQDAPSGEYLD